MMPLHRILEHFFSKMQILLYEKIIIFIEIIIQFYNLKLLLIVVIFIVLQVFYCKLK